MWVYDNGYVGVLGIGGWNVVYFVFCFEKEVCDYSCIGGKVKSCDCIVFDLGNFVLFEVFLILNVEFDVGKELLGVCDVYWIGKYVLVGDVNK